MMKAAIIAIIITALAITGCSIDPKESSGMRIPMSEIGTSMHKYSFDIGGTQVRYFAVLGSDGKPRVAFDACDVCGGKLGYRQDGDKVVCNKCGKTFKIDDIGTENTPGGCWPSYLAGNSEGNYLVLNKKDIEGGASKFT